MNEYELQQKKVSELEMQLAIEKQNLESMQTSQMLSIKKGDYCLINECAVMLVRKVEGDTFYGNTYDSDLGYDDDDHFSVRNTIKKLTKEEAIAMITTWHTKVLADMQLTVLV